MDEKFIFTISLGFVLLIILLGFLFSGNTTININTKNKEE